MVIDYKDITFSFKAKRRKKRLKRIRLIVIVLFVIISIIIVKNQIDLKKIQYIQELLLQDKINEAENAFKKIEKSIFHKKTKKELKALILLFNHKTSDAEKILEKIKNKTHIIFSKFLDYFSDKAEYLKLKIYTDYLISRGEDTFLYKAIYKTAFFNFKHTFKTISQISPENREKDKKTIKIINDLNAQLKSGKVNYILDIKGEPLAYYDIKKKKNGLCNTGFQL